jgi:hypothetical protein
MLWSRMMAEAEQSIWSRHQLLCPKLPHQDCPNDHLMLITDGYISPEQTSDRWRWAMLSTVLWDFLSGVKERRALSVAGKPSCHNPLPSDVDVHILYCLKRENKLSHIWISSSLYVLHNLNMIFFFSTSHQLIFPGSYYFRLTICLVNVYVGKILTDFL